ncbi:magnesium transporter [Marinicella gelatinilytica]|uniref:magnesium transporter n=1 Tax=Marinicella gelatinilytica TaxID=2996017 RepID=UPI0022608A03|nr:magnesium transporter [Marinicella gelatinilytica]MCX7543777.1 magnesium transporter [Marinicella gelatinilytica]
MLQHQENLKSIFTEYLESGKFFALRRAVEDWNASDIAVLIETLSDDQAVLLFRLLRRQKAAQVFENLSHKHQQALIQALAGKRKRLADLLNTISPDDRTAFFGELPGEITQKLLTMLNEKEQTAAIRLLGYPEDSIGRLMTTDYVAVKDYWTVNQALDHIRKYGIDSETINVIYVINDHYRLIDDLRIRDLILADPKIKIQKLMDNRFVALQADADQETAIQSFKMYDRIALPVTDSKGVLIGIVTVDDVLDVAEEEATEDFHKFGSLQDSVLNPLEATVGFLYRKRIVWLFVLVMVNVFSGAAIASFESTIQSAVALVFFLPLLIDSGGNAGSQSATIMVRALATGEAYMKDWLKLIAKEIPVALLLGSTMAVGVAAVAGLRAPEVVPVVAMTMVAIVMVGSLVGLSLPFIFTRVGVDPATASAPLITSIADISGVIIYFSIANWWLGL